MTRAMSDAIDYAGGDKLFAEWLHRVDELVSEKLGVSLFDLPDRLMLHDFFDDEMTPGETASLVVEEEGDGFEW